MGHRKCCVSGCNSTSQTRCVYSFPKNKDLRKLWLSYLVPHNSSLLMLTEDQLLSRTVCQLHFERRMFDAHGVRLPYAYPCLFSKNEISCGIPLATDCGLKEEHNYCLEAKAGKLEDKHLMSLKSNFILRPRVEQRKLYCVSHDHGYKVKRLLIVSGVSSSSAPPPPPSDEEVISEALLEAKEEDPLAFEEHEDVTNNKQQLGKLALDDPLAYEDVTDNPQQFGKLALDVPLADEYVTDHPQQLEKLARDDTLPYEDVTDNPQQFGKLSLDEVVPFPLGKVARPEPPKNETKVNKPEDPFLPQDPFLPEDPFLPDDSSVPDALDPEIIKDSVQPDNVPTYGDNIHPKLCVLWPPILRHGLTTEARNKILNGYLVPKNCRLFQAPMMNAKIVEMVPEKAMANDSKWATMQQYIGTALTAINRAMESLLLGEPNSKVLALQHLSNACLLLSDLHGSHTKIRVKNVTPYLDDTTQEVIKELERDETVFGDNFIKKWKMAKKLEKPVKEIRPPKKEKKMKVAASSGRSLVLYSGRWHPPLRKTGKVRRKKVGAGVRRQNVSTTDTPLPTPRKRRVRESQVRAPDHLDQHILTSTQSELAQNNPDEDVQSLKRNKQKLKRPTTPKTYGTKKRKQEEKIDALSPDIETSHIHNMPMEESDSFVQEQIMEEELNQSSITYTPNSTVMVTTGAVPLVLPPQLTARDMPTLLTYDENVPPDPSTYIEIVDDQTPQRFVDMVNDKDCQLDLSLFLRFKDT